MAMLKTPPPQSCKSIVIRCSCVAILLSALTGCMVGPDFHKPETQMPAGWVGVTPTTAPTTGGSMTNPRPVDVSRWWQNFNDPELNSLIDRAVASNLDLKLATSRLLQARASAASSPPPSGPPPTSTPPTAARAPKAPSTRSSAPTALSRPSLSASSRDLFQAGLDAGWELDVFGGVRRDIEAANADIRAAVEDRRDVLVTLTSEVALNYISLRGYQRQLYIARENLAAQERSADVTRRRQKGGFISGLDTANADAQVANTRSTLPVFQQQAQQTIYDIALLLGAEPDALLKELSAEAPIPPTPPEVPIGLPSDLLKHRPDIRRAQSQWHAANARIGVATADLFPKFAITGSVGTSGPNGGSLFNWDNGFWSIGPSVSYEIFDAGRIRANIAVQNELTNQAALSYEQTVLAALRDVESALVGYAREQQHRAALTDAVAANQKAVDLSTSLYKQGQTDFLNVLTAQRSLFASQDALVQSNRTIATNLVALYKALGGGWQNPRTTTQPTTAPTASAGAL